jgi:hypothetical protein
VHGYISNALCRTQASNRRPPNFSYPKYQCPIIGDNCEVRSGPDKLLKTWSTGRELHIWRKILLIESSTAEREAKFADWVGVAAVGEKLARHLGFQQPGRGSS